MAKNKINYKKLKLLSRLEANEIMPQYSISPKFISNESYNNPRDLVSFMRPIWPDDMDLRERMFILFVTANLKVKGFAELSVGGYTSTTVPLQLIGGLSLITGSSSAIMFHNHPSGNTEPSKADDNFTQRVSLLLHIMDIELLDHIIIAPNNYYSYKENGKILEPKSKNDFFKKLFAEL